MNNLAYIPTKQDKVQLLQLLQQHPISTTHSPFLNDEAQHQCHQQYRQLSKQELAALLARLTKKTKKQYDIQQQTTHILKINQELQQKRRQGEKVQSRLIAFGKQRNKKIVELGEQLQKENRELFYRDIPQISQKGHNVKQKAIERRLDQLMAQRLNKKQQLKHKYQPSFHPNVNPHSQFINDIENLGDLFNRMNVKEKEAQEKKETVLKQIQEKEKEQLTFKPKINQKSRDIAENLPPRIIPGTPFQPFRQPKEIQVFPFAPTINKNTEKLLANREKDDDCFRRLYNHSKQYTIRNQVKQKQRDEARSFHPSLNSKSMKLVHSKRQKEKLLDDGHSSPSRKSKGDQLIQEVKIGNKVEAARGRTYSVRESTKKKPLWQQEPQNKRSKLLKYSCKNNTHLMA